MTKQESVSEKDTQEVICELKIVGCYWKENCFPSLNDLLAEATRSPMAYGRLKRQLENIVILEIRKQLKGWKATERIRLDIHWGEKAKGKRRDYDNVVSSGRKVINDALVKAGVLKDDNPVYLGYGTNTFEYVEKPYIRIQFVKDTI